MMSSSWTQIAKTVDDLKSRCDMIIGGTLDGGQEALCKQRLLYQARFLIWQLQDPSQMVVEYCSHVRENMLLLIPH